MSSAIQLEKNNIKIRLEEGEDAFSITFNLPKQCGEELDNYMFLLNKIDDWINSGEYKVDRQKESSLQDK